MKATFEETHGLVINQAVEYAHKCFKQTNIKLNIYVKTFIPLNISEGKEMLIRTKQKNDGFILYEKNKTYNQSTIYKIKPKHLCTADLFVIRKDDYLWFCMSIAKNSLTAFRGNKILY